MLLYFDIGNIKGNNTEASFIQQLDAQLADNLAQAKSIVETEPERAARLIQGWVADDHG